MFALRLSLFVTLSVLLSTGTTFAAPTNAIVGREHPSSHSYFPYYKRQGLDAAGKKKNGEDAQKANQMFGTLKEGDACDEDGASACVGNSPALCNFGKWTATGACTSGLQCYALPLVNAPGISTACDTEADALARIEASGATGGLSGSGAADPAPASSAIATATADSSAPAPTASDAGEDSDACAEGDEDCSCEGDDNTMPDGATPSADDDDCEDDDDTASATKSSNAQATPSAMRARAFGRRQDTPLVTFPVTQVPAPSSASSSSFVFPITGIPSFPPTSAPTASVSSSTAPKQSGISSAGAAETVTVVSTVTIFTAAGPAPTGAADNTDLPDPASVSVASASAPAATSIGLPSASSVPSAGAAGQTVTGNPFSTSAVASAPAVSTLAPSSAVASAPASASSSSPSTTEAVGGGFSFPPFSFAARATQA